MATISLKHGSRPWIGNEPLKKPTWMERKNPPAYTTGIVAAVCLHCPHRDCLTSEGCDEYHAAVKAYEKQRRAAR